MFSISREAAKFLNTSSNNIKRNYDMNEYIFALSWPIDQDNNADAIRGPQISLFSKEHIDKLDLLYRVDGMDIYASFDPEKLKIAENSELHYDGRLLIYR